MKIKSLSADNGVFMPLTFPEDKDLIIICGRGSDTVLDLLRMPLCDTYCNTSALSFSAVYAEVEAKGICYDVCCIPCDDGKGGYVTGVGFEPGRTAEARQRNEEYASLLSSLRSDNANVFDLRLVGRENFELLFESDRVQYELCRFIKASRAAVDDGDTRPLFVYGAFDRIDEAKCRASIASELLSVGCQVFVSASSPFSVGELLHDAPCGCMVIIL